MTSGRWMWSTVYHVNEADHLVGFVNDWTLRRFRELNGSILAGRTRPEELVRELNERVLPRLPGDPRTLRSHRARKLLVHLSLFGASVARHLQQRHPGLRSTPAQSLTVLVAGELRRPFLRFFTELAEASGTGHPHRDSYASLVRWNAPTVRVQWAGEQLAVLDGAFSDSAVRTYTAAADEVSLLMLLKKCEAVELVANELLEPICCGGIRPDGGEARQRVRAAATMLAVVHRLLLDFGAGSDAGSGTGRCLDEFLRFPVHWRPGDIPPSRVLSGIEYLKRDFLLGIDCPGYADHVRRVFPGLLAPERQALAELMGRPTLPELVLNAIGIDRATLTPGSVDDLVRSTRAHPVLADYFLLLRLNAKVGASRLALAKATLPLSRGGYQRLARLTSARGRHPLDGLRAVPMPALLAAAGRPPAPSISDTLLDDLIRVS